MTVLKKKRKIEVNVICCSILLLVMGELGPADRRTIAGWAITQGGDGNHHEKEID